MRRLLCALLVLACVSASGQSSTSDFRTRSSVCMDWKIRKGLHLEAGYEMRTADNLSHIERNQLNVGVQYSPLKHFSIGTGYYFIGHYNGSGEFRPRHRAFFDLAGSYRSGPWKLSLRERVQMTHLSYDFNHFQQTPNLVELKSRLKLAYKGMIHLEPYAYLELRNSMNGPSFTADFDEQTSKYSNYSFGGYSDAYLNRIRGAMGLEWNIDMHHGIDFKVMADKCHNREIDTNSKGTKLKSVSWEDSWNTILAISYTFSF